MTRLAPMTLPDDIELAKELDDYLQNGEWGVSIFAGHRDILVKELMKFIATYRKKWETEARIDELNSISEPDKPGVYDPGAPEKPLTINERITELQGENK